LFVVSFDDEVVMVEVLVECDGEFFVWWLCVFDDDSVLRLWVLFVLFGCCGVIDFFIELVCFGFILILELL